MVDSLLVDWMIEALNRQSSSLWPMTKKCRAIMFKNMKIGTKIALGFAKDFKRKGEQIMLTKAKNIRSRALSVCALLLLWFLCYAHFGIVGCEASDKTYVGSDACMECHETEYKSFKTFSHKRNSFKSIKTMKKRLTDEEFRRCFECHTTGYGKPGGFKSEAETPHLKNAGCEVCHGQGSIHVETGDPEDIDGQLTVKVCETCHSSERVGAFHYKPLIYGGAH